jgi:hypothetical protein
MNFCRSSCIDINSDNFSPVEKKCLKSCSNKYIQQFEIFNKFKDDYEEKYPMEFIFDEAQKKAYLKLIEMMRLNENESNNLI